MASNSKDHIDNIYKQNKQRKIIDINDGEEEETINQEMNNMQIKKDSDETESKLFTSTSRRMSDYMTACKKDIVIDNDDDATAATSVEDVDDDDEEKDFVPPTGFFTVLNSDDNSNSRKHHRWEKNANDRICDPLMERLLRNPNFTTAQVAVEKDNLANKAKNVFKKKNPFHHHKTTTAATNSSSKKTKEVVTPLFDLIGIDVFKTLSSTLGTKRHKIIEGPAFSICTQDVIKQSGLRDKGPMFIMNFVMPYWNIVVYYKMPSWVKNFQQIVENDDDSNDIRALKRFLKGDAHYRNTRLQFYMSAVWISANLQIKAKYITLPSPKAELTTLAGTMPLTWRQGNETYDATTGEVTKYALLECDCDVSFGGDPRETGPLIDSIMKFSTGDIAFVIGELPQEVVKEASDKGKLDDCEVDGVDESKPSACLGFVRLDHVDLRTASKLPPQQP